MKMKSHTLFRTIAICVLTMAAASAAADGMQPATSVLLISEDEPEATMKVKNTDPRAGLLHVAIESIPEDDEPLLLATPALARVESGDQQLVRFVLQNESALKIQRLRRIIFDGIPESGKNTAGSGKIGVTIRHNIPAIISPKGLPMNPTPWTGLKWSTEGQSVTVANDSPYVVRVSQQVQLLPANVAAELPKAYILPGEKLHLASNAEVGKTNRVRFQPANNFGFARAPVEADVE